jgi:hypothetical protein
VLGPIIEPRGGRTDAADDLLRQPGGLSGDRVPEFGARRDVAQYELRLVAREHPVGDLARLRRGERGCHEALQLAARGELGCDPFEDAVADERARDLFRQRAGQRPVDDTGDLGRRENLVTLSIGPRQAARPRRALDARAAPALADSRGQRCALSGVSPRRYSA